jgi:5-methyltetrahydrofolate--homocysteine methyltransferase
MIPIVQEIRSVNPDIPVLIHANAGMPVYENGQTVFPETPDEMCESIPELIKSGANIIGGCCGTTPDHIRKMVETIKK